MDSATRALRDVLRDRERLRARLRATEGPMHAALDAWADSRPGAVRGKATEAGASYLLRQLGVL